MKAYFLSVLTLLAVLSLALWNSASMAGRTQRWQGQLDQVEALATDGAWEDAYQALEESYGDWSSSQAYLHIVSHHDVLDEAEAMYRRAIAAGPLSLSASRRRAACWLSCRTYAISCGFSQRWNS